MTQETERLKTQLLAAEVEIARLQSALDEIRLYVIDSEWNDEDNTIYIPSLLHEINRITGTDK